MRNLKLTLLAGMACMPAASAWGQAAPTAPTGSEPATPLAAQAAPANAGDGTNEIGLGDIVVTAQRREQKSQTIGISITAFSGKQLDALGVNNAQDLVQITPGLRNPQGGNGLTSSYAIRGLTQSDFGASQEAPVALYVDDVYQSSQGASKFLLFDVNRVEVLRGPQGTLFGRNATGGLVNFITNRPNHELAGAVDVTYSRYNQVKPEAFINVPVSDTVATRLSFGGDWRGPIVENTEGQDLWNSNKYAGRFQILWEPTSDLDILLNARAAGAREIGAPYIWAAARPTGEAGTGVLTPGLPDNFGFLNSGNGNFRVSVDPIAFHNVDTYGGTATVNWHFGNTTLTSITDYTDVKVKYAEDSDMQPGEFYHYYADQKSKQFSQEIRLAGKTGNLQWTTGAYYLSVNGRYGQEGRIKDFFESLGVFGITSQLASYTTATRSFSLFGQFEYSLNDKFKVISGARYIRERKRQLYNNAFYDAPGGTKVAFGSSPDLLNFNGTLTQDLYSLREEIDWTPSKNVLVYASYNRGVKSGGFNAPGDPSGSAVFIDPVTFDPAPTADAAMRFKPEVLHAFQIGAKNTLFGGRARFNVEAFIYKYKNFQAVNLQGITQYITNNDADIKGFDAEFTANPVQGLDLMIGASYLDQVVRDVRIGSQTLDRKIPYAPEWNILGLARYEWDALGGKVAAQTSVNYVSDQEFTLSNSKAARQKGFALVNARLGYTFPDKKLAVSVFVDNLTNKIYDVVAFDLSAGFGSVERQIGLPRVVGITLHYDFGK